MHQKLGFI
jgi:hypothetical protein